MVDLFFTFDIFALSDRIHDSAAEKSRVTSLE